MKVTLWYKHDKQLDTYSYNHLEFNNHSELRVPIGSTIENTKKFKTSKWLKEHAFLENRKVIYKGN